MIELSLFNGMNISSMAMEDAGIKVTKQYISEIDKHANRASELLFPGAIQLGDIISLRRGMCWKMETIIKAYNSHYLSDKTKETIAQATEMRGVKIDVVKGGFPCQAWSMAGKQMGDKDPRGKLFWVMLDIMKEVKRINPNANFLIENVRMKKEFEEYITHHTEQALGEVHKTLINSALASAQNRSRYYWTNFPVTQPEDQGLILADILEDNYVVDRDKAHCIDANYFKGGNPKGYFEKHRRQLAFRPCEPRAGKSPLTFTEWGMKFHEDEFKSPSPRELDELQDKYIKGDGDAFDDDYCTTYEYDDYLYDFLYGKNSPLCHHSATATDIKGNESIKRVYSDTGKAPTLTTMGGGHREPKVSVDKTSYRKLTPRECMRLQTIPERYIDMLINSGISNTQLYKMTGNAWTMKVISHILKCMVQHDK